MVVPRLAPLNSQTPIQRTLLQTSTEHQKQTAKQLNTPTINETNDQNTTDSFVEETNLIDEDSTDDENDSNNPEHC